MAGYWPRRDRVEVYKHAKKEQGKYLNILTKLRQGFGKFLLCDRDCNPEQQESAILPAQVHEANHSVRFGLSCPVAELHV